MSAALLSACQTGTQVVLLPQDNGKPSAVVVRARNTEQTLSQPYQRATTKTWSSALGFATPKVDKADPANVKAQYSKLFTMAPAKSQRFTLYFDAGGTVLTSASQSMLKSVLEAARSRLGADIVVTGHTDTQGSREQNDQLSFRRAQEISQLLVELGFPHERIEAVGRGERELAVPTAENVDEPRNRRVAIEIR